MKTRGLISVLALFLMTASAHAVGMENRDWRLFEFNFNCNFGIVPAQEGAELEDQSDIEFDASVHSCSAVAQVYAYVQDRQPWNAVESNRYVQNKLAVQCGDRLVYADGAVLDVERRFVSISGLQGWPELTVLRHHDDHLLTKSRPYRAFLQVDGSRLRGYCEVRNRPVH
jgi:hypothetical protein